MWQEIIVGIIIAASAIFIGVRIWNSATSAKRGEVSCSCGCSSCAETRTSGEQCRPER